MKHKKDWIIAILLIIIVMMLFFWYSSKPKVNDIIASSITDSLVGVSGEAEIQKDATKQAIDEAVNKAILGDSINEKTETPSITDAIKDTLNNVNTNNDSKSSAEIIEIESSNKLKLKQDGKEISVRLIGVHENGSKQGLQSLLESTSDLRIETDTKKSEGNYKLVYLWNGEPKEDCSNMINIQMIKKEYAYSTYDFIHPGVIETPNIKYQSYFIDAIK